MGYNLFSFGISQENIKSVFNSKDKSILDQIKASGTFKHYNENSHSGISVGTALTDIINGSSYSEEAGYQYGYAVICMCATLGYELPYTQEIKLGYETDFINQFLSESFNVKDIIIEEKLLPDNTNPFQIPPIEDWPVIGFIPHPALLALKEKFANIHITEEEIDNLQNSKDGDDEEKGFAYQHIKGIIDNIDFCIKNNLGLITFCH